MHFQCQDIEFIGWSAVSDSSTIIYNCNMDYYIYCSFEFSNEIILPEIITENTTLTNRQPYIVNQNLLIPSDISLTIQEGVEVRMFDGSNINVEGQLIINGTEDNLVHVISS